MGAGEWTIIVLVLGAVGVVVWFHWRAERWKKAAKEQQRRADDATESEQRRDDLDTERDKSDDDALVDFINNFGGSD